MAGGGEGIAVRRWELGGRMDGGGRTPFDACASNTAVVSQSPLWLCFGVDGGRRGS